MTEKYTRGPDVTDSWWCCGGGTDNGHAPWCKSKGVYTREEFIMQHATRNSALHIIGLTVGVTVATFALAFAIEWAQWGLPKTFCVPYNFCEQRQP